MLLTVSFVSFQVEVISTALCDVFQRLQRFRFIVVAAIVIALFLIGILFCTPAGAFILISLDYIIYISNMIIIIGMCVCVAFFYGLYKLRIWHDVQLMLSGRHQILVLVGSLMFLLAAVHWFHLPISAVVYTVFVGLNVAEFDLTADRGIPEKYVIGSYVVLGVILLPMVVCPIAVLIIATVRGSLSSAICPSRDWGPQLSKYRQMATHLPQNNNPLLADGLQLSSVTPNYQYAPYVNPH
jgi:hypothetical protein